MASESQLNEPLSTLPEEIAMSFGTCSELKMKTESNFAILPHINKILNAAGQVTKVGIYDYVFNENIDLDSQAVVNFILKAPSNNVNPDSERILNIVSHNLPNVQEQSAAIINEIKKAFLQSTEKHYLVFRWHTGKSAFSHVAFEERNERTRQRIRLAPAGDMFVLKSIDDGPNRGKRAMTRNFLAFDY
ncbi:hypothetical protein DdX_11260 [Ditylenchus destructor]|uniref:Uncharacterized protein n=1 Tax=Ditylenchus destructor TaxID=166010 RepID=A0AAD4MYE9_9BILA|nr:hypothetical protein DdX_11260 [Ditylenchus destructor]